MSAPPSSSGRAPDVRQVGEREGEPRERPSAPDPAPPPWTIRAISLRLRVVAVHERLHQHEARRVGARRTPPPPRPAGGSRASRRGRASRRRARASSTRGAGRSGARCRRRRPRGRRAAPRTSRAHAPMPCSARVRLGARRVAACDGDDVDAVRLRGAGQDLEVDVRRRQQAESHRGISWLRSGAGARMCGGGTGRLVGPGAGRRRSRPSTVAQRLLRRARDPRRPPSRPRGAATRPPTIAAVTPGWASTHATASAGTVVPSRSAISAQALDEGEVPREKRLLEGRRRRDASRRLRDRRHARGRRPR